MTPQTKFPKGFVRVVSVTPEPPLQKIALSVRVVVEDETGACFEGKLSAMLHNFKPMEVVNAQ